MNLVLAHKMAQPIIHAEVIQKLNVLGAARNFARARRSILNIARENYRRPALATARDLAGTLSPSHLQRVDRAYLRHSRTRAGVAGLLTGGVQGVAEQAVARRIVSARRLGARVGRNLRAGFRTGYNQSGTRHIAGLIAGDGAAPVSAGVYLAARAAQRGVARSTRAGRVGYAVGSRVPSRIGRTWVNDSSVNGGGYWRRHMR